MWQRSVKCLRRGSLTRTSVLQRSPSAEVWSSTACWRVDLHWRWSWWRVPSPVPSSPPALCRGRPPPCRRAPTPDRQETQTDVTPAGLKEQFNHKWKTVITADELYGDIWCFFGCFSVLNQVSRNVLWTKTLHLILYLQEEERRTEVTFSGELIL